MNFCDIRLHSDQETDRIKHPLLVVGLGKLALTSADVVESVLIFTTCARLLGGWLPKASGAGGSTGLARGDRGVAAGAASTATQRRRASIRGGLQPYDGTNF